MRKLILGLGIIAAVAIPAGAMANPPHNNDNGPHKDYISGTATVNLPTPLGTFAAQVSSNGTTEPNGHSGDQATGTWQTDFFGTPLDHNVQKRRPLDCRPGNSPAKFRRPVPRNRPIASPTPETV